MNIVLNALLAPIVRLCVARDVPFPQVADRLKAQFVKAATTAIAGKTTDSRISVMTGLQRREIARLRVLPDDPPIPVSHLSRLVARWVAEGAGALSRKDFDALAEGIRRDVHPATQLAQLIDAGTVLVDENDMIVLLQHSYQPLSGSDAQLEYLARNGADFLSAAVGNALQNPAPFFERAVHYNGLSAESVAELEKTYRAAQMALLEDINARAAELQKSSPGDMRFRAGGYFYKENTE